MRATTDQVCWVRVEDIVDVSEGAELTDSQTVLLARRGDGRYTLLAGGERLRLAREQGLGFVDAVVSPTELLGERVSRLLSGLALGSVHYLDEAEAYRSLLADGMTVQELASRLGSSSATIRRRLRLTNLGADVCEALRASGLREGYAQELLRLPGRQGRLRVLARITEAGLSVREAETLVGEVLARMPVPLSGGRRMKPLMRDYRLYLNAIRGVVEQMRDAGLDAGVMVTVGRRVAEARVTIPLFLPTKAAD